MGKWEILRISILSTLLKYDNSPNFNKTSLYRIEQLSFGKPSFSHQRMAMTHNFLTSRTLSPRQGPTNLIQSLPINALITVTYTRCITLLAGCHDCILGLGVDPNQYQLMSTPDE